MIANRWHATWRGVGLGRSETPEWPEAPL